MDSATQPAVTDDGQVGTQATSATAVSPEAAGPSTAPPSTAATPKRERLLSWDAFRGVTIAGMLLVNNPGTWGAVHPPLLHAEWHGWTLTDLIFPFFLFIVGVSMTLSFGARGGSGRRARRPYAEGAAPCDDPVRLGLLLHGFPNYLDLATLRIPGVLQRIALAYLAASAIVLYLRPRGQAAAIAVLLLGYWAVLMLVPFPGGSPGVLEPGQDIGAWIDRLVFTENHLWQASRTWDPEGLFSTLPAVATVLLGVFAGRWLQGAHAPARRAAGSSPPAPLPCSQAPRGAPCSPSTRAFGPAATCCSPPAWRATSWPHATG
jgi:predicted acyltransferase